MSWQNELFLRLRDREWHQVGALFSKSETAIPLHNAMRQAMQPVRKRTELPSNFEARWKLFLSTLSAIGVESAGPPSRRPTFEWNTLVRLRYVSDRSCPACAGPVIKAGWSGRSRIACLACEQPVPVPVPVPAPTPTPSAPDLRPYAMGPEWGTKIHVGKPREMARYLKQMLGIPSINATARELERQRYDPIAVLTRHGTTWPDFVRWLNKHYGLRPYRETRPP